MHADLFVQGGRHVAKVTLLEGERVDVDVDKAEDQERVESIFTGPTLGGAGFGEIEPWKPFSRPWFRAILLGRVSDYGYTYKTSEEDEGPGETAQG